MASLKCPPEGRSSLLFKNSFFFFFFESILFQSKNRNKTPPSPSPFPFAGLFSVIASLDPISNNHNNSNQDEIFKTPISQTSGIAIWDSCREHRLQCFEARKQDQKQYKNLIFFFFFGHRKESAVPDGDLTLRSKASSLLFVAIEGELSFMGVI